MPAQFPSLALPSLHQAGWLRLNMGAIHMAQGDYAAAARQFRMALDFTPPAHRRLRLLAQRNVGLALVRSGRYGEAAEAFAAIMQVLGVRLWVRGKGLGERGYGGVLEPLQEVAGIGR